MNSPPRAYNRNQHRKDELAIVIGWENRSEQGISKRQEIMDDRVHGRDIAVDETKLLRCFCFDGCAREEKGKRDRSEDANGDKQERSSLMIQSF
jgi:hypothetical protein